MLMVDFGGVQLSFRCCTLSLVSLRSQMYAESSCEIDRDMGHFRGRDAGDGARHTVLDFNSGDFGSV